VRQVVQRKENVVWFTPGPVQAGGSGGKRRSKFRSPSQISTSAAAV